MAKYETSYMRRFAQDPDFRQEHRTNKVEPLTDMQGRTLRGKRRPVLVAEPNMPPNHIPETAVLASLVARLHYRRAEGLPILDKVVDTHTFRPTAGGYNAYVYGAKLRTFAPPEPGDNSRDFRQEWHARDNTRQNVLTYVRAAQLRRAGIAAVLFSFDHNKNLPIAAALHTADAIEDFGASLHDNPAIWRNNEGAGELDADMQHIGYFAAEQPAILSQLPRQLFRAVKIEQGTREAFWQQRYDAIVEVDGDQRTTEDKELAVQLNQQIASFGVHGVPEIV